MKISFFQTNVCIKYKWKVKTNKKKIDVKNRACYYFDDIIKNRGTYLVDILLDEKLYDNISVYHISYQTSTSPAPLRIRFDKIDGFIRVRGDEFRHLVLFDYGLFDKICEKIKYLIVSGSINHNFGEIKIGYKNR